MHEGQILRDFRRSVRQSPHRRALSTGLSSLTFVELESAVDALSLDAVRPTNHDAHLVPVVVDTSLESLVAVFALVARQVPFVLLDGGAPGEYLGGLLNRVGSPAVVVLGTSSVPSGCGEIEVFASLGEYFAKYAVRAVESGEDDALILFTSGSTGAAKGVRLSARTIEERVEDLRDVTGGPAATVNLAHFSPVHFIAGLRRLLLVSTGASLLSLDLRALTVSAILELLRAHRTTHLAIAPTHARLLAAGSSLNPGVLECCREIQISADQISYSELKTLKPLFPETVDVFTGLGATEAQNALSYRFRLADAPSVGFIPLGAPNSASDFLLRDRSDIAEGLSEVLMARAIASGYLGDDALIDPRFHTDDGGRRWWCSGDLVRQTAEGAFEFAGRVDDLVKVNGRLVSPAESTRALLGIPGVEDGLVVSAVVRGSRRLVGFYSGSGQSARTPIEVAKALAATVPAGLVPFELLLVARMPTTARGKVDRAALLELLASRHGREFADEQHDHTPGGGAGAPGRIQ